MTKGTDTVQSATVTRVSSEASAAPPRLGVLPPDEESNTGPDHEREQVTQEETPQGFCRQEFRADPFRVTETRKMGRVLGGGGAGGWCIQASAAAEWAKLQLLRGHGFRATRPVPDPIRVSRGQSVLDALQAALELDVRTLQTLGALLATVFERGRSHLLSFEQELLESRAGIGAGSDAAAATSARRCQLHPRLLHILFHLRRGLGFH